MRRLAFQDTRPWHYEGLEDGRWILLDYSDVVVHIMLPDVREYYKIEDIWPESVVRQTADS